MPQIGRTKPRPSRACCTQFIYDGDAHTRALPASVDAFFQFKGGGARQQHSAFLSAYGLSAEQTPLLELDPYNWNEPFRRIA